MNKKELAEFKYIIAKETNKFIVGEMCRALRVYRYALRRDPKDDNSTPLGIACGALICGIHHIPHIGNTGHLGQLYAITCLLVSLLIFMYLERANLLWKTQKKTEFQLHSPDAHLLFPAKS